MKTPLALFRGFQLASGVTPNGDPLKEAATWNYFHRDRVSRYHQARLIAAAAIGDKQKAEESLKILTENLFPELEEKRMDFRKHAESVMQTWRNKVVTIEGRTARIENQAAHEQEIAALSRQRLIRRRQGRKRRGWR